MSASDSALPDTNTVRVHRFIALTPGPRLIVLGGVHGNETCGTEGIARVVAELETGALRLKRGHLTLVPVANPLARQRLQREGERNLNRQFRPTPAGATPPDYEARITDVLCPLLAAHDVLLDLHSFQSAGEAFAMIGPRDNADALEPFARAFEEGQLALHLGTSRVVEGWLDIYAGGITQRGHSVTEKALAFGWGTNEFMRSQGGYGVTLECGQHRGPAAPEVAYRAVHAALDLLGMTFEAQPAERPVQPELLRLRSVTDRGHVDDKFVRDWASFDPVHAGERIGTRHDGTPVLAEGHGFIVFPNAEAPPGTEWFYFAVGSDRNLTGPATAAIRP